MKKCVLFDLDGTILDTLQDLTNSVNYALKKNNFNERTKEEVLSFIGDGIRKLLERALPDETPSTIIENCLNDFKVHYDLHMSDNTKPYPRILELMKKLKDDGYKLGVVSNKYYTAVANLCKIFDDNLSICIGEGPNIPKKPNPTGTRVAMKLLKVTPQEVIFVGDSKNDYEVAKNAGTSIILVSWGYTDYQKLLTYNVPVAQSSDELYRLIKNS